MSEWREIFEQNDAQAGPGPDFEEKVFRKIKKKKMQRKVGFTAMALAGTILLLSFLPLFHSAPSHVLIPGAQAPKQEIPLSEDLLFSASDSRTRYSLEPVSYRKKPAARDAALNQI